MKKILALSIISLVFSACGFKPKLHTIDGRGSSVFIESQSSHNTFEKTLRNELAHDSFIVTNQKKAAAIHLTITHKDELILKPERQSSDEVRVYPLEVAVQYSIRSIDHSRVRHESIVAKGKLSVAKGQTPQTGQQLKRAYETLYSNIARSIAEQLVGQTEQLVDQSAS